MTDLARLRIVKGYTQQELAQMIQTTQGTVSNWEKGRCLPRGKHLRRLAEILGLTIDELLDRIGA